MSQEGIKQIRIQKEKPKVMHRKRGDEGEAQPPETDTKKVQQKGKEIKEKADEVVEMIDEALKEAEVVQEELKRGLKKDEMPKRDFKHTPKIPLCDGTMVDPRKMT